FDHALGTSAGSLSPRTKFKELARYEFSLPPVPEQRRVAEIMRAAGDAVERAQDVVSALDLLAASVVEEAEKAAGDWLTLDEVLREPPRNGLTIQPTETEPGAWSLTIGSVTESGY